MHDANLSHAFLLHLLAIVFGRNLLKQQLRLSGGHNTSHPKVKGARSSKTPRTNLGNNARTSTLKEGRFLQDTSKLSS
jgi:hypothetical protein